MGCAELEKLRGEIANVRKKLSDCQGEAQRKRLAAKDRRGERRTQSDIEAYLERRLNKAAAAIEHHLAQHRCA